MSIERFISQSVYCSLCGVKGMGNCRCWVKLRCPSCGRGASVERTAEDGDADVVEADCPLCVGRAKDVAPKRSAEVRSEVKETKDA